ncbi:Voltage-dependent anion-selective channel protein 3 [Sciurus carolinensis]|uniref:Non-selective voltage-gated ion channel VDAC3 n=1 Tax=Sciurus carolinensis TaxID=30640 RepID=A0AA41N3E3_SCICA|nr:Voltage-dependent anion-selective channel protein 3 [Sciurus carolinensis]
MCNTPTYRDLGKAAEDVLNKGYGFGMVKIDLRTTSWSGVEFSTSDHALKASYKWDCFIVGSNVDIDFSGPTIYDWAVLAFEDWLAGYQMSFDTAKSKLSQNNFALGYKAADFQLQTPVNDGTEFGSSIYQKVHEKTEMLIDLAWTAGSNNTRFGIAAKYKLDCRTFLSAKVNIASLIGLGYTQTLQSGVKLTLSALINAKNFSAGGHKVELGFDLEA